MVRRPVAPWARLACRELEERAGAHVDDDRDRLLGAAALVDEPDDVAQQAGRQVVDDEEAEVLQLLGRRAAAGAGHAGDDDQLAALGVACSSSVLLDLAGGGVHADRGGQSCVSRPRRPPP